MAASRDDCKGERAKKTLDAAHRKMLALLTERFAERATGRFGVLVTLDNGYPTKVSVVKEETITLD